MKAVAVILSCLLVAASWALPRSSVKSALLVQERSLVVNAILAAIEEAREQLIANGFEPLEQDDFEYDLAELRLPGILEGKVYTKDLTLHGLTKFRIENMNYGLLTSTVTFDMYIDVLTAEFGHFELHDGVVDGDAVNAKGKGNVEMYNIHVNGRVRVSIGIISGVTVRSVNLRLRLGGIKSDAVAHEISGIGDREVNEFIESTTMHIINTYHAEISNSLNDIVMEILESIL